MAVSIPIVTEFDGKGISKAMAEFQQLEGAGAKSAFALKKRCCLQSVFWVVWQQV